MKLNSSAELTVSCNNTVSLDIHMSKLSSQCHSSEVKPVLGLIFHKSSEIWKESDGTDNSCFFFSLQFLRIIPFSPAEESPDIFIFLADSTWSRALARLFDYQMTFWLGMCFLCSLPVVFSLSSFSSFLCPLSLTAFSLSLHCFMSCIFPLSKTNTILGNSSFILNVRKSENYRIFNARKHPLD